MNLLIVSTLLLLVFGQAHLEQLIRKPVESEQTAPLHRIAQKWDLQKLYPLPANASLLTYNASIVRTYASPNFKSKYQFVFVQNSIYFLTSVDKPANLKVNVFMNSSIKPGVSDFRKYTKVFHVKEEKPIKSHLFEFKVNNQIDEILKHEKEILNQFESKLWKGSKPSLAYISLGETANVSIASSQKHSDFLEEFCFLGKIPQQELKIAGLEVMRRRPKCGTINVADQKKPVEDYVVNAFVAVGTRSLTSGRFFPALIAGAAGIAGITWGTAEMINAYNQNSYDDDSIPDGPYA